MTIISFVSNKGGVGKTTSAISLAGIITEKMPSAAPILVDTDNNASATIWDKKGLLPFIVTNNSEIASVVLSGGYGGSISEIHPNVILDTAANLPDSILKRVATVSDLVIIPTTPDLLSVAAVQALTTASPISRSNYIILVTMAPTSSTDGRDVIEQLKSVGYPVFSTSIRRYEAYRHAVNEGTTVGEVKGRGGAWVDWTNIYDEFLSLVKLKSIADKEHNDN